MADVPLEPHVAHLEQDGGFFSLTSSGWIVLVTTLLVVAFLWWHLARNSVRSAKKRTQASPSDLAAGLQRAREKSRAQAEHDLQIERERSAVARATRVAEEKAKRDAIMEARGGHRLGGQLPESTHRGPFMPPDVGMRYEPYTTANPNPNMSHGDI